MPDLAFAPLLDAAFFLLFGADTVGQPQGAGSSGPDRRQPDMGRQAVTCSAALSHWSVPKQRPEASPSVRKNPGTLRRAPATHT